MHRKKSFDSKGPALYLVPTPIGNLQEMTPRALDVLKAADVIAAEDTRNSGKLLMAYGIKKPLISHHEHNQSSSIPEILEVLNNDKTVAVISDAGYPLISDPGQNLVNAVIEKDIPVISVSGANAATNALVASGLSCRHYLFYGFLDAKSGKRKKELEQLRSFPYTIVFYEAPHRIQSMLLDVGEVLGDRKICLARELTKMHEEYIRGTVFEVAAIADSLKGEMVVVVEGNTEPEETYSLDDGIKKIEQYIQAGMKTKAAITQAARDFGLSKNELYDHYHKQGG